MDHSNRLCHMDTSPSESNTTAFSIFSHNVKDRATTPPSSRPDLGPVREDDDVLTVGRGLGRTTIEESSSAAGYVTLGHRRAASHSPPLASPRRMSEVEEKIRRQSQVDQTYASLHLATATKQDAFSKPLPAPPPGCPDAFGLFRNPFMPSGTAPSTIGTNIHTGKRPSVASMIEMPSHLGKRSSQGHENHDWQAQAAKRAATARNSISSDRCINISPLKSNAATNGHHPLSNMVTIDAASSAKVLSWQRRDFSTCRFPLPPINTQAGELPDLTVLDSAGSTSPSTCSYASSTVSEDSIPSVISCNHPAMHMYMQEDLSDWLTLTDYHDVVLRTKRLAQFRCKRELERQHAQSRWKEQAEVNRRQIDAPGADEDALMMDRRSILDEEGRGMPVRGAERRRPAPIDVVKANRDVAARRNHEVVRRELGTVV